MFAKHPQIAHRWVAEAKEAGVSPTKHKRRRRRRKEKHEMSKGLAGIRAKRYLRAARAGLKSSSSGKNVLNETLAAREKALLEAQQKRIGKSFDLIDIAKAIPLQLGERLAARSYGRAAARQIAQGNARGGRNLIGLGQEQRLQSRSGWTGNKGFGSPMPAWKAPETTAMRLRASQRAARGY
jgi:hypothetical protein